MEPTLAELLPHRPPMVMVDALVRCEDDSAVAVKTFAEGSYGTDGGCVLEGALIECLAQTVAALHGHRAHQGGGRVPRGLLVGVTDFAFRRPASCGRPLQLTVRITRRLGPFCLAAGRIEQDGSLVAEGELKFHLEEDRGGLPATSSPQG
jgi:predicted hotdog family 3-hydroxylacyl-ACP dehydratase